MEILWRSSSLSWVYPDLASVDGFSSQYLVYYFKWNMLLFRLNYLGSGILKKLIRKFSPVIFLYYTHSSASQSCSFKWTFFCVIETWVHCNKQKHRQSKGAVNQINHQNSWQTRRDKGTKNKPLYHSWRTAICSNQKPPLQITSLKISKSWNVKY